METDDSRLRRIENRMGEIEEAIKRIGTVLEALEDTGTLGSRSTEIWRAKSAIDRLDFPASDF